MEVLVALIAASLILTLLMPATLGSLKRIEFDAKKDRALFLARSKLEWISAIPDVSTGVTSGQEGDLSWEIAVADPYNSSSDGARSGGVVLREIQVRIMEGKSTAPLIAVSTQRLYVSR